MSEQPIVAKPTSMMDAKLAAKKAFLVGAARGLKLLERMPPLFLRRGWRVDQGRIEIAEAAICLMALGALGQPINVPKELWDSPEWRFAGETEGRVTAAEVVAHLDLKEMLRVE